MFSHDWFRFWFLAQLSSKWCFTFHCILSGAHDFNVFYCHDHVPLTDHLVRFSTVRSLFFPISWLSGDSFLTWHGLQHLIQAAHLWMPSSPRNGQPSHPASGSWHPILGHSHVWIPSSPCLSSDTPLPAFAPHRRCLLPCFGSPLLHGGPDDSLEFSTLIVFHVAGHTHSELRHPMPPPQTPAHLVRFWEEPNLHGVCLHTHAGILQGHPSHRDLALTSHSKLPCHATSLHPS